MITWKYVPSTMVDVSALFPILYNAFFNSTLPATTSHSPLQPTASEGSHIHPMHLMQQQQPIFGKQPPTPYTPLASIAQGQWAALNASVGGRLYADGTPFAQPCFDSDELQSEGGKESSGSGLNTPSAECKARQEGYLSEAYRLGHFGSSMNVREYALYAAPRLAGY